MATRIFLCNRIDNPSINDLVNEAIYSINEGSPYRVFWECGDIKTVKTGDKVFFKRTQDKPLGYFASGEDVEVRGISGTDLSFILTAGELSQAEQNLNFVLWAVTSAQSKDKHLYQWSGIELLKSFNFNPIAFKAKLKEL